MAIADAHGLPIALCTTSAQPHEVKLVEKTLASNFVSECPEILIGDGAYDSDKLDDRLSKEFSVTLVAPHKKNRVAPSTQDGRVFRRYKRRWKVERLFAWIQNFRRTVVRYERHVENFTGFVQLACIKILLRHF